MENDDRTKNNPDAGQDLPPISDAPNEQTKKPNKARHPSQKTNEDKKKSYRRSWRSASPLRKLEIIALVIGGMVGVGYLLVTIWGNLQAKWHFQAEHAASVTIGTKDGVLAEFVTPEDKTGDAAIVIYFQNHGHFPAKFNWGTMFPKIMVLRPNGAPPPPKIESHHVFSPLVRIRNKSTGSVEERGASVLIDGDSVYKDDLAIFPYSQLDALKHNLVHIQGIFEYCDALGNYTCRQFAMFYQGGPIQDFRLMREEACLGDFTKPSATLGSSEEYAPLCEAESEGRDDPKR